MSKNQRVPGSKGPKVQGSKGPGSQGPRVPRSQGLKDQDILKSYSSTSLILKKVHLVLSNHQFLVAIVTVT